MENLTEQLKQLINDFGLEDVGAALEKLGKNKGIKVKEGAIKKVKTSATAAFGKMKKVYLAIVEGTKKRAEEWKEEKTTIEEQKQVALAERLQQEFNKNEELTKHPRAYEWLKDDIERYKRMSDIKVFVLQKIPAAFFLPSYFKQIWENWRKDEKIASKAFESIKKDLKNENIIGNVTKETTTPPITEMPEENVTPQYTNEQVIHQGAPQTEMPASNDDVTKSSIKETTEPKEIAEEQSEIAVETPTESKEETIKSNESFDTIIEEAQAIMGELFDMVFKVNKQNKILSDKIAKIEEVKLVSKQLEKKRKRLENKEKVLDYERVKLDEKQALLDQREQVLNEREKRVNALLMKFYENVKALNEGVKKEEVNIPATEEEGKKLVKE